MNLAQIEALTSDGFLFALDLLPNYLVEKEAGKGLSTNDFTNEEKEKLASLANYILKTATTTELGGIKVGANLTIDENGVLSAKSLDWDNIDNKPTTFPPSTHKHEQSEINGLASALNNKVNTSALGQANGVATLDANGLVPSTQLPSYVDDVIEGYYHTDGKFYKEAAHTTVITGEGGKIYLDISTNISYRFGGTAYTKIVSNDVVAMTNEQIQSHFSSVFG